MYECCITVGKYRIRFLFINNASSICYAVNVARFVNIDKPLSTNWYIINAIIEMEHQLDNCVTSKL